MPFDLLVCRHTHKKRLVFLCDEGKVDQYLLLNTVNWTHHWLVRLIRKQAAFAFVGVMYCPSLIFFSQWFLYLLSSVVSLKSLLNSTKLNMTIWICTWPQKVVILETRQLSRIHGATFWSIDRALRNYVLKQNKFMFLFFQCCL